MITPRRTRLIRVPDLHAFRRAITELSGQPGAETLVVVPNRAAAWQIQRVVRASASGASFLTRDEMYREFHARLPDSPRLLTATEREAILQASAAAASDVTPQLTFRIRPGLVAEMLRFYDQLRRQSQTVERFAELIEQAIGADPAGDRGAERMLRQTRFIQQALSGYEQKIDAIGAYDEHRLRTRLTERQLSGPVRRIVVTVADWIADPDGLFLADFDVLTRMPGVLAIEVISTEATLASGFHQRIREWLPGLDEVSAAEVFGDVTRARPVLVVPAGVPADQLWFVRRDREEELAAAARTFNGGLGVVYKRPLPYLYLADATLGAAAVPYQTFDALPLAAEPTAAAVDLVFDAVETSFSRESLVALLRSPHFDFSTMVLPAAVSTFDRLLSEKRYLGDVDRLAAMAAAWPQEDSRRAAEMALTIARSLAPLAERAAASAQLGRLRIFLDQHWKSPDQTNRFAGRERRARSAVDEVLDALTGAHSAHHDPQWTFADLAGTVRRWIEEKTFEPEALATAAAAPRPDAIACLVDDQAARYGDFEHLAIVGLIENDWPERPVRNIFYPPALLKSLGWPSEHDRRAAADSRFLDLLVSASRSVTLSTFSLDDESLVSRSTQLDEVAAARLATVTEEVRDLRSVLVDDGLVGDPPIVDRLDEYALDWLRLRQMRPAADRPEFHGVSGRLAAPARTWSVSAVETYLGCPFKFFARHVLNLDEEPEDEEILDPRRQGQFVHAVFEEFFRLWQSAGRGGITPDDLDAARAMFKDVVDRQLARSQLSDAEAGLERTRLLGSPAASGLGEAVFRMEAERPVPVVERLLEYSVSGELTIATSSGPRSVSLRGKADRVDLLDDGTFRLIDYKLGWPPDRARALQLPIYGVFAEQRLQNHRGRRFVLGEAAYLAFKGPRRVVPLFTSAAQRVEVMAKAQERLAAALDAIGRGEFPPTPDDVYRCESCAFTSVCRKDYVDS